MAARPSGEWFTPASADSEHAGIDTGMAYIARVYDFWAGGNDNYAADRTAADEALAAYPAIRASVRAQRAFIGRAVRYLAAEAGLRQFLDLGTGLPSADNTHEIAQRSAPSSRVVYVDHDPIVLAHARALLASAAEGATAYIDADVRDTGAILAEAATLLDFTEPVAVLMFGLLHCIPDDDDPAGIVAQLVAAVPPGSYLAIAHPASDVDASQMRTAVARVNTLIAEKLTMRSHAQVSAFFAGLQVVPPGVVQLHRWRPGPEGPVPDGELANYGGVARKR